MKSLTFFVLFLLLFHLFYETVLWTLLLMDLLIVFLLMNCGNSLRLHLWLTLRRWAELLFFLLILLWLLKLFRLRLGFYFLLRLFYWSFLSTNICFFNIKVLLLRTENIILVSFLFHFLQFLSLSLLPCVNISHILYKLFELF